MAVTNAANRKSGLKVSFYLREAGEHVGPFCSRRDVDSFLALMRRFGADTDGIEIVELKADAHPRTLDGRDNVTHECGSPAGRGQKVSRRQYWQVEDDLPVTGTHSTPEKGPAARLPDHP